MIAEEIQRDPSQVQLVKGRGQVLFCWTDDQNNPAIVQHLKSLGVDGVIYDRIDVNSSKEVKQVKRPITFLLTGSNHFIIMSRFCRAFS